MTAPVITGRIVRLSRGRSVFVGRVAGDDKVYVDTVNDKGHGLHLAWNADAADVLRSLLNGYEVGEPHEIGMDADMIETWRVVRPEDDE